MIAVTRLSDAPLVLNAELIRTVEARPDTYITLTDGDRIIVKDSVEDVVGKVVEYRRRLRLAA